MPLKEQSCTNDEVVVCNTTFKFVLTPLDSNTFALCVTRCNAPTAVYDIALVRARTNNCCGQNTYYQATVNSDPVEIIQDCSLHNIVRRAIEIYFSHLEPIICNGNNSGCRCGNNNFLGIF